MRNIPLIVTNSNNRAMDIDVHYRQVLNQKLGLVNERNNGWFAGGSNNNGARESFLSSVDRVTFSNDTTTSITRGSLSGERVYSSGSGNFTDGWIAGGRVSPSDFSDRIQRVDRITFAQDGQVASIRGPLSIAKQIHNQFGNTSDGWFVGGTFTAATEYIAISNVDRISFSNDNITASARNSMPQGRGSIGVSSNNTAGWIISGFQNSAVGRLTSNVRLTFVNDTSSMSTRGNLTFGREAPATLWNTTDTWVVSGVLPNMSSSTSVERIIFASDTTLASLRGNANREFSYSSYGQQNTTDGWYGGGVYVSTQGLISSYSNTDRLTFSNDTSTHIRRGQLSMTRMGLASP